MTDKNHVARIERRITSGKDEWPIGNSLPNPTVQLFFWGIMGFRYDSVRHECEVGFHHGSPTHRVKVVALEDFSNVLYESPDQGLAPNSKLEFEVVNRPPDVTFLRSASTFRRNDPITDPTDFRWLIDLEHPDFYGFQLPMTDRVFRIRLSVKHGVFYTFLRSCASFDVVGGPNEQTGIYIARYIGANLDIGANECLSLKVDGTEKLPINKVCGGLGKTYQFFFVNNCKKPEWCNGSDFYLNFDAVAIPHSQRFELVLNKPCDHVPPNPFEEMIKKSKGALSALILNTDDAPCMGTGYGQGGGFPLFPPG